MSEREYEPMDMREAGILDTGWAWWQSRPDSDELPPEQFRALALDAGEPMTLNDIPIRVYPTREAAMDALAAARAKADGEGAESSLEAWRLAHPLSRSWWRDEMHSTGGALARVALRCGTREVVSQILPTFAEAATDALAAVARAEADQ